MPRPALFPLLALTALAALVAGCAPSPPRIIQIEPYFAESAGLTQPPQPGPLPDAQAIRAAFFRPVMAGCDALSCWYDLDRLFRVRAIACEPIEPREANRLRALCRYERQLVPRKGEPGPWRPAETRFSRSTDSATPAPGWYVERDLTAAD